MNEQVPNLKGTNQIRTSYNDRLGLKCIIPRINIRATQKVRTLKDNSFAIKGPRLFNSIPKDIRNELGKLEAFKNK